MFKIGTEVVTLDDEICNCEERLVFVLGELECPVWMLGNKYRYKLAAERRELHNKINRLIDERNNTINYDR